MPVKKKPALSVSGLLSPPVRDYLSALNVCLHGSIKLNVLGFLFFLIASWWLYVPIHEMFHAFGCIVGDGKISRLDLSPVYGAVFLKQFFPFISVGSEYAGQLTGFTTFGSDLTYFLTDFFPYLLTIILGIPLLRSVSSKAASPFFNSIKLGIAVPFAYAPFVAVTGDYYEMGSIIISKVASFLFAGVAPLHWRSDDALKLSHQLFFSGHTLKTPDVIGVSASFFLGIVLIFCTYRLGVFWSGIILKRTEETDS